MVVLDNFEHSTVGVTSYFFFRVSCRVFNASYVLNKIELLLLFEGRGRGEPGERGEQVEQGGQGEWEGRGEMRKWRGRLERGKRREEIGRRPS